MVCINELLFMCLLSLQTHFVHMSYPKAIARASRPRGVLEMQATTHSGQYDFWAWSMRAKSKTQLCKAYLVIHTPSSSVVPALLHVDDLHFRSESKLSHGYVCVYIVVARTVILLSANTTTPLLACTLLCIYYIWFEISYLFFPSKYPTFFPTESLTYSYSIQLALLIVISIIYVIINYRSVLEPYFRWYSGCQ